MIDGIYQSILSFFIPYIFVVLTTTGSGNGLDVSERTRLGCYIAHPAVLTINSYILINTYRWDWLMILVVVISDVFIFFWTGVYTSFTYAAGFYQAAPQIYQELTFWMCPQEEIMRSNELIGVPFKILRHIKRNFQKQ